MLVDGDASFQHGEAGVTRFEFACRQIAQHYEHNQKWPSIIRMNHKFRLELEKETAAQYPVVSRDLGVVGGGARFMGIEIHNASDIHSCECKP